MLRLYLDEEHGASVFPCERCGHFLILAAQRRGRSSWMVTYDRIFRFKPGRRAMLVCPSPVCDYQEDVTIADSPVDAVPFSQHRAAALYLPGTGEERPLGERLGAVEELEERSVATGNPKLPWLVRRWREDYQAALRRVYNSAEWALQHEWEVECTGRNLAERGHIRAVGAEAVELQRSEDGEQISISWSHLAAIHIVPKYRPARYDFGAEWREAQPRAGAISTPLLYVQLLGHPFEYHWTTRYGLVRVSTSDERVALSLGLTHEVRGKYPAEFPLVLVQRHYRLVRQVWVQGHKLQVRSLTQDPDVFEVSTWRPDVARALRMNRDRLLRFGRRRRIYWHRYIHRSETEAVVERQVPIPLDKLQRQVTGAGK